MPIPQEYLDWRLQKREKLEAEERLINLHKKLGSTPQRWEVWLSKIKGGCGCGGCLLFYVTMQIGGLLLQAGAGALSFLSSGSTQEANPDASLSAGAVILVLLPYLVATLLVLAVLTYARRKVLTLASLQGKLVASPPVHPGGPSTCRGCGGPLEVTPGQVCSPCYYCGSQNLVSLDPEWCEQLRGHAEQSRISFAEAMRVYNAANKEALKKLVRNLAIFAFLGWLVVSSSKTSTQKRWPPVGFEDFQSRQAVLGIDRRVPELRLNTPISFEFHTTTSRRGGELQNFNAVYFFVPLSKGEKLTVELSQASEPAKVAIAEVNDSKRIVDRRVRKWKQLTGKPAVHTAQKKSWHCVSIAAAKKTERAFYTVQFTVEGRDKAWQEGTLPAVAVDGISLNMKPTKELEPIADSDWKSLGGARVLLDEKGRVKRVQGSLLNGPITVSPKHEASRKAWLEAHGPGAVKQVLRDGNELIFERTYTSPTTVLKISDSWQGFVEFEISRGESNDGLTVEQIKAPKPATSSKVAAVQGVPFQDFLLDDEAEFSVRGIRPGDDRKAVEEVLGKPKREWGRYAHYGEETVCYWNGKVRWIRSRVLSQGGRPVSFSGPSKSLLDKLGKPFLWTHATGQPRALSSFIDDGRFFRRGSDILGVHIYNGKILGAVLMAGDVFGKGESKLKITGNKIEVGAFVLEQGETELDKLYRFMGQEHLHYLLQYSSDARLFPQNLESGKEKSSFQVWLWTHSERAILEYWKQNFHKVKKM